MSLSCLFFCFLSSSCQSSVISCLICCSTASLSYTLILFNRSKGITAVTTCIAFVDLALHAAVILIATFFECLRSFLYIFNVPVPSPRLHYRIYSWIQHFSFTIEGPFTLGMILSSPAVIFPALMIICRMYSDILVPLPEITHRYCNSPVFSSICFSFLRSVGNTAYVFSTVLKITQKIYGTWVKKLPTCYLSQLIETCVWGSIMR